jgi:hypothetical protein
MAGSDRQCYPHLTQECRFMAQWSVRQRTLVMHLFVFGVTGQKRLSCGKCDEFDTAQA